MYAATWAKKRWRREGGKKRGGQWEKCFSPDDAVKLKSFDLCPKPYLHRLLSLLKALPSSCSETVGVFSLLPQPRGKVQYPFVAAAAPPVRTNAALPYLFILKEAAPVRGSLPLWAGTGFSHFDIFPCCCTAGDAFLVARQGFGPHSHTHTHPILFTSCTSLKLVGVCVCVELGVWVCACMCGGVLARWPDAVCWPCPALINML